MMQRTITSRDLGFMDAGLSLAKNSLCRARHGAIITRGNKIISQGINILRTHPITEKRYGSHVVSIHAELRAIIHNSNVAHCTLYSVREHNGEFANSRPCKHCLALIIDTGIREVVFWENGEFIKIRI